MKKLISLALALIFVFSMATVAMAAVDGSTEPSGTVTMKKDYYLTNSGTVSPAETISFTVTPGTIDQNPAASFPDTLPTVSSIVYNQGDADKDTATLKTATITLPTYSAVGVYNYTITESGNSYAGVTYRTAPIRLVVTVVQDGADKVRVAGVHCEDTGETKSDTFVNTYSAGSLDVKKVVTGYFGDITKKFDITVTFTSDKAVGAPIYKNTATAENAVSLTWVKDDTTSKYTASTTISLAHNENVTFLNIPYGVTYAVSEADYTGNNGGYDAASYDGNRNGTILSAEVKTVVTNNKSGTPDTGITLDSLPFILILAVCAGAVVLFVIKRRRSVDF